MLNGVMLIAVMLNVVAPLARLSNLV
jgi:hypothetical protein